MITKDMINVLADQSAKKKLITGKYVNDSLNDNFQYIKWKFYPNEELKKVQTLVSGSGLFESIANTVSYYIGNPKTNFFFPTANLAKDYCALWFATFWLERIDGKLKVVYLPAENYIEKDGIDYIIRSYELETVMYLSQINRKYFFLVTSYIWGTIENKLYQWNTKSFIDVATLREVPLDSIPETNNLEPMIVTWLDKVFRKIQEDKLEQFPISLIDQVKQIVYSIDRNINMFDTQFLQNVESFVIMKGISLPTKIINKYEEHWKIDFRDLWRYITADADGSIEFVQNSNNLIKDAIAYEGTKLARVSSITNIPMDFLWWNGTAWAVGEGSRELLHWSFIKKIISLRELFDEYITQVIDILKKDNKEIKDNYSRDDVFSKNTKQLAEELKIATEIWLISKRTALKRYLSLDDSEIDLEFWLIDDEWVEDTVVDTLPVNDKNDQTD